jgi:hypothetical protein
LIQRKKDPLGAFQEIERRRKKPEDRGYALSYRLIERTFSVFAGPAPGPREPEAEATLF